ncbi:MAG: nucleotidyltransferase domain-containing protein [Bacteroidia bacterium]|nr:nucleotidyltransferase domain-containing protein [Bacteroidia bacterium]
MKKDEIFSNIIEVGKNCNVKKIILFGSLAKKIDTKYSDIDLIFIFDEVKDKFIDRPAKYLNLLYKKNSGYDIDLFVYSESEWNNIMVNKPFINEIKKGGILLYEQRAFQKRS